MNTGQLKSLQPRPPKWSSCWQAKHLLFLQLISTEPFLCLNPSALLIFLPLQSFWMLNSESEQPFFNLSTWLKHNRSGTSTTTRWSINYLLWNYNFTYLKHLDFSAFLTYNKWIHMFINTVVIVKKKKQRRTWFCPQWRRINSGTSSLEN